MSEPAPTGPRAVLAQLQTLWGKQSKTRRLIAAGVLAGIVAIVGISRLTGGEGAWSTMNEGGSPDDVQELLSALQARDIPARIRGGKVEVPADKVDEARAVASAAGLPRTGKGYELFDGTNLGQSSFTEQVNFKRALQGELARSIQSLAQVQGARVHLALGKRSVFKDSDERASASVALHLHPGQTLSGEQVRGIRKLVAASVEGLAEDAVVVVDNHGNLLDGSDPTSSNKKSTIEQGITLRVRNMLERVVGAGKVSVATTAVIDDREINETAETFDNQNPVLRSEQRVIDSPDVNAASAVLDASGVAGTRGNLPGAAAPGAGSGSAQVNGHLQQTRNYEISRKVTQTRKADPQIQRLHLAIVIDEKVGEDGKPVVRKPEEMAALIALAREAAGIDDARGDKLEMRSIRFAPDDAPVAAAAPKSKLPLPLPVLIGLGAGVVVLLSLAVWALRRKKKAKAEPAPIKLNLAFPAPVGEIERALDARDASDKLELPESPAQPALPAAPIRERVIDAVRGDLERTAELLTVWLSEPPPDAAAALKGKQP